MSETDTYISEKMTSLLVATLLVASAVTGVAALSGTAVAQVAGNTQTLEVGVDGGYDSVQAAIDDANPGDRIHVYPGTYEESAIDRSVYGNPHDVGLYVATDNVSLVGVDQDGDPITDRTNLAATIVSTEHTAFGTNGAFVTGDNVTIQGLEIEPDPDADPNKNVEVVGDGVRIEDSIVRGAGSLYFATSDVQSFTVVDSLLTGSVTVNNGAGNATAADSRVVRDSQVGSVGVQGSVGDINWLNTESGVLTVRDTVIQGGVSAVGNTTTTMNWTTVLESNSFPNGAVMAVTDDSEIRTYDYTWGYDTNNDGENDTITNNRAITSDIQSSVDIAQRGDTVVVEPGTYDEQVTISKNLSLVGSDGAIITRSSAGAQRTYAGNSFVVINDSATVSMENIQFDGPFQQSKTAGIFVTENASLDASNLTMTQMYKENGGKVSGVQAHGAIALGHPRYTESPETGSLSLTSSTIDGFGKYAIQVSGDDSAATLHGNSFEGNGTLTYSGAPAQDTILVDDGDLRFENNTVSDVGYNVSFQAGAGVSLYGDSDSVSIANNTFRAVNKSVSLQAFRSFDDTSGTITGATVEDNVIEDGSIAVDLYSDGIDSDEHLLNDSTITDNEITDTNTGVAAVTGQTDSVDFEGNTFSNVDVVVYDGEGDLPSDRITDDNAAAFVGDTAFGDVGSALQSTEPGDTVTLTNGTFAPFTVSTANVTVVGSANSVVAAENATAITLAAPNSSVEGVTVDVSYVEYTGVETQAVLVTANDTSAVSLDVDIAATTSEFEEVSAVQVFDGDDTPTTGVRIADNDIDVMHTTPTDGTVGASGVNVQGNIVETVVTDNDITVHGDGYSFAMVSRQTASPTEQTPRETAFTRNTVRATANQLNGVGFGLEGVREPSRLNVTANDFLELDAIEHKSDGTLDVTGNYFADLDSVEFITTEPNGVIVYDPFLTAPSDEQPDDLGASQQFGHDLTIPVDDGLHAVAFPGPVDGTVSEVIGPAGVENVYAYDASTDEFLTGSQIADRQISALDAFLVDTAAPENASIDEIRITVDFADAGDEETVAPEAADLDEGWNFVGAPQRGQVQNVYALGSGTVGQVVDIYSQPGSQPYDAATTGTNVAVESGEPVSPFEGYWVFVNEETQAPATVTEGVTLDSIEDAVSGSTRIEA